MRDIDGIIEQIMKNPDIPPVYKQILINRIEVEPTREEIEQAKKQINYGH